MSDKSFFVKVDNPKLIEVIDFLIHNETEIVLKIKNFHYKSKVLSRRDFPYFLIYKFSFITFEQEETTCSFEISNEKYFFKSTLTSTNSEIKIAKPTEIFQLQRRNDFRVAIPLGMKCSCNIIKINSMHGPFKVELRDLSLGGCQIAFPTSAIKMTNGDEVILSIEMNQFQNEKIYSFAKHLVNLENAETTLVGLKFDDPDAAFLTELQTLLVHLDRIRRGKGYE